jgi:RimJ/RimL family protein N-acetyltransferase
MRRRAQMPDEAFRVTVTPFAPSVHGVGFLLHVWMQAVQSHEAVKVFGPAATTVETFIQLYRNVELVVAHRSEAAETWPTGDGILAVAYLDDLQVPARARLHHYVYPTYRTPRITTGIATLVLHYSFEQLGLQALYGLTPSTNRGAIRFAKRLGFEPCQVKPMVYEGQVVEGIETVLTRARWHARQAIGG